MDSRHLIDKLASTPLSQIVLLGVVLTLLRVGLYWMTRRIPHHKQFGTFSLYRVLDSVSDSLVYAAIFVFMLIRPFAVQAYVIPSGSMWPTLHVGDFIVVNKAVYRRSDPKIGDIVVFRPPVAAAQVPSDLDSDGEMALTLIKRCIGAPGDVVELREGVLYRNGKKVDEPYTHWARCTRKEADECTDFRDYTDAERASHIPQNFKFVKYKGDLIPLDYTQFDANLTNARADTIVMYGDELPYNISARYEFPVQTDALKAESLPPQPIPRGYYLMMGDNRNNSFDGRAWGLVSRDRIIGRSEFTWLPFSRWGLTR
jgi:signal peptidase I